MESPIALTAYLNNLVCEKTVGIGVGVQIEIRQVSETRRIHADRARRELLEKKNAAGGGKDGYVQFVKIGPLH